MFFFPKQTIFTFFEPCSLEIGGFLVVSSRTSQYCRYWVCFVWGDLTINDYIWSQLHVFGRNSFRVNVRTPVESQSWVGCCTKLYGFFSGITAVHFGNCIQLYFWNKVSGYSIIGLAFTQIVFLDCLFSLCQVVLHVFNVLTWLPDMFDSSFASLRFTLQILSAGGCSAYIAKFKIFIHLCSSTFPGSLGGVRSTSQVPPFSGFQIWFSSANLVVLENASNALVFLNWFMSLSRNEFLSNYEVRVETIS